MILSYGEMMLADLKADEPMRESVEEITTYVQKPITPEALMTKVREVLDGQ